MSEFWQNAESKSCDLILEGGAMRSLFTAGVCDALLEKKFYAHRVIGVSAGALIGMYYVAGYLGYGAFLNMRFCQDWRYLSLRSFVITGNAAGREFLFDEIPNDLFPFDYERFDKSPMKLISVASNLETGEANYHLHTSGKDDMEYLIASSSMPLVSQIVEVDGLKLLDGGTCDSVPINYSLLTGPKKHIVVATHDRDFVRKPTLSMPLMYQHYSEYPYYTERAMYRHYDYNRTYRQLARMHDNGEAFVLFPPEPVEVSSMEGNPEKLLNLYCQGYETTLRAWPDIQSYMQS